jgi:septum formation protein
MCSSPPIELVLASRSPRRRELLQQVGIRFTTVDVDIDETPVTGEPPREYVLRMAREKAAAGLRNSPFEFAVPVLGADTSVVVEEQILGKPVDTADALRQLRLLSGRAHQVLTAIAIANPPATSVCVQSTVWFRTLDEAECHRYCASGEPFDKAGSYGIQGQAAAFVARLDGSYSAVMGLPLFETCELLAARGVIKP